MKITKKHLILSNLFVTGCFAVFSFQNCSNSEFVKKNRSLQKTKQIVDNKKIKMKEISRVQNIDKYENTKTPQLIIDETDPNKAPFVNFKNATPDQEAKLRQTQKLFNLHRAKHITEFKQATLEEEKKIAIGMAKIGMSRF